MDPNAPIELLQAAAALAAVARLTYLNLARQFPALLAFLVFLGALDLAFGVEDPKGPVYFWTYIFGEPLECVLAILAVRELLALTFADYPGIRTVGRWVMYSAVALSLCTSLLVTGALWE